MVPPCSLACVTADRADGGKERGEREIEWKEVERRGGRGGGKEVRREAEREGETDRQTDGQTES